MNQKTLSPSKSSARKSDQRKHQIPEDIRQLVLARLRTIPDHLGFSIGSSQYTKDEVLRSVERGDPLGREVADIEMDFIRSLASGSIYDDQEVPINPKDVPPKNPHHTPQP